MKRGHAVQSKQSLWAGNGEMWLFAINNGTILLLLREWLKGSAGRLGRGEQKKNQLKLWGSTIGEMSEEDVQEPKVPFLSIWLWKVMWPPSLSPIYLDSQDAIFGVWGKESQQNNAVLCWSRSMSSHMTQQWNGKGQHMESPRRSVAETQAPGHAKLLGQELHFPWDMSKHS